LDLGPPLKLGSGLRHERTLGILLGVTIALLLVRL
jgi:tetrahydromethanopterin S-methyltransferase subunit F